MMDERELTRRFFGIPHPDPLAKARARARLDERMRRGPRRGSLAVAAAVIVGIIGTTLIWSVTRPNPAAAESLRDLAAIRLTGLEPGSDQYLHRTSTELRTEVSHLLDGGELRVQVLLSMDLWIAADGSGERRSVVEEVRFATDADEAAWSEPGAPPPPHVGDVRRDTFGPGEGPYVPTGDVPTDPHELLDSLRSGRIAGRGVGDAGVFALIGDLLAQGNLPQETRASLLEASGRLDGIRLLGSVNDPIGRPGQGYAVRTGNDETRLVFDPGTGELLAREHYMPDTSGTWHLVGWEAFTSASIVSELA